MATYSLLDYIEIRAKVPRGEAGFWAIMLELDAKGPWTAYDVDGQSNVSRVAIRNYLSKLVAGGFVEIVEVRNIRRGIKQHVYRLLQRQFEHPRLDRQGRELPELQIETIWRTIKMLKQFTVTDVVDNAPGVGKAMARRYLCDLASVGVLNVIGRVGKGSGPIAYHLIDNLGARAPKILKSHIVFDPNSGRVLGQPTAEEVQP